MVNPNPNGTAPVTDESARVPCDDCGRQVPRDNLSVHRAACQRRSEAPSADTSGDIGSSSSSSISSSANVNLLTAYILWCFGGVFGVHHAYLNRPHQGLGWYATGGLFGWGLLRDLYRMPTYVSLARRDSKDSVAAKVRAATVEARNGVPKISLVRIVLMGLFGSYFGWVASCLVSLPHEQGWTNAMVYGMLRLWGTAAGVWLVGNMGEETLYDDIDISNHVDFLRLVACCLVSLVILDRPVLGGIYYAVRLRRYRPSMMMSPTTPSATRRIGRHLLTCAVFTILLTMATYNHGSIVVNHQKVYFHEALRNAFHSDFWHEFDWNRFREESSSSGGGGRGGRGGDYLKNAFDLRGERAARRTLGVAKNAEHTEVRAAYKKLALKFHPDKIGSNATEREVEKTKQQFVKVQEAYEVLNDIEQRRKKREAAAESQQQQQRHNRDGTSSDSGYSREERQQREEM